MNSICPKCKSRLEHCLRFEGSRLFSGAWCESCDQTYHTRSGCDESIDIGLPDSDVSLTTSNDLIIIQIDGSQVTLSGRHAELFCKTMHSICSATFSRKRREKIESEQLNRWLVHSDGASYRNELGETFRVMLRETKPRKDWSCTSCQRMMPSSGSHWIGVYTAESWGRPQVPRFCRSCIFEASAVKPAEAIQPKGLRLVVS